jgi:selenoprotein W-related protein
LPKAAREAVDLLTKHFPKIDELSLVPSTGGVFEVTVNDKLIFSKKALERFPEEGEIVRLFEDEVS